MMNCSRRRFLQFAGTSFAVFATSATAVFAKPKTYVDMAEAGGDKTVLVDWALNRRPGEVISFGTPREDISDLIYNIEPKDPPFVSQWRYRTISVTPDELTAMYRRNGKTELLAAMWQRGQIVVKPVPVETWAFKEIPLP